MPICSNISFAPPVRNLVNYSIEHKKVESQNFMSFFCEFSSNLYKNFTNFTILITLVINFEKNYIKKFFNICSKLNKIAPKMQNKVLILLSKLCPYSKIN